MGESMQFYDITKKVIDFLLALIGLLLLWPFFLIIAIIIKLTSHGPVLFKQKRLGENKTEFYILKFRTMRCETPKDMPTHLLNAPDIYITKVGKLLRKTSLDEIPQLINIIKGQMSFVGPRPALWNQFDLISERDKYSANNIKPGLTGWAQVNGRDEISVIDKAKLDGEYKERLSLVFDFKIIVLTAVKVLKSDGVREGEYDQERASSSKGAVL